MCYAVERRGVIGIVGGQGVKGQGHSMRHDYTISTLDVLKACDACADMGQL